MGVIVQAFGSFMQGDAAAHAANYNAQMAVQNAQQQKENAAIASQAGAQQTGMASLKTRATVGSEIANQAVSGVDTKSGSSVQVQQSSHEIGMLDALQVRSNATKAAFGYEVAGVNDQAQGALDKYEAKNDELGAIVGGATTLIGGAEDATAKYGKFLAAGGM